MEDRVEKERERGRKRAYFNREIKKQELRILRTQKCKKRRSTDRRWIIEELLAGRSDETKRVACESKRE